MDFRNEPLQNCIEIDERKVRQLNKKGINTIYELVRFLPRQYEDRSQIALSDDLFFRVGEKVSIVGYVNNIKADYIKKYFILTVIIDKATKVTIKWFNQIYVLKNIQVGDNFIFFGKLEYNKASGYAMTNPTFFSKNIEESKTPFPVYSKVSGMSTEFLQRCIDNALDFLEVSKADDCLEPETVSEFGLENEWKFLRKMHHPKTMQEVNECQERLVVEVLAPFVKELTARKWKGTLDSSKVTDKTTVFQSLANFNASLPFELTHDQRTALRQMIDVTSSGKRLNALVQGDVGCGKTIIAIEMAYAMHVTGYQTAVMAPTTVLAEQHLIEFTQRLAPFGVNVAFLNGKLKAKEKRELYSKIQSGEISVVVGTHAVIQKDVQFSNLGLTIVDEEHRFGVEQRDLLHKKAEEGAHCISMTATPIPRTLAVTIYGENTAIYNIHTMPAGRKPIQTIAFSNEEKTYEAIRRQIALGHQAYIVCPLIVASEAIGDVDSLEETYEKCCKFFEPYPDIKVAYLNGKMKQDDIKSTIGKFANGEINILLSTTIVEVGVNVPNATVMVVKNAERFGLAQLHQLRGRVGRGSDQAYCVLLTKKKESPRIQAMVETNDGFAIAQKDLELRGTGNVIGTEQSGYDKSIDYMLQYPAIYKKLTLLEDKKGDREV